jgi:DNA/RNA-binding domain of Phe-tRNA-synthetase-like protein
MPHADPPMPFPILEPHDLLDAGLLQAEFPQTLDKMPTPRAILGLLNPGAEAPLSTDAMVCAEIRDVLRKGGYRPTGRGKPASEYLSRAASEGSLGTINLAVDLNNGVSLHSGLPISVIDLDRAAPPYRVRIATPGESYVFNRSGQAMDLAGLLCLCDAVGPCANAVKDSERTKTWDGTTRVLYVLWGSLRLPGRTAAATRWLADLLQASGANVHTPTDGGPAGPPGNG